MQLRHNLEQISAALLRACAETYGERLVSLAIFGSAGRGTARPDSDLDLILVASPLPDGRGRRIDEFGAVERRLRGLLPADLGAAPLLSPVLKTPAEVGHGSPLFLDMTEDAQILFDRGDFFARELARLRERLAQLGARRIWRGNAWFWDLKPDYRPGEVFEL
jgi:predicted nucleotidyltransferase